MNLIKLVVIIPCILGAGIFMIGGIGEKDKQKQQNCILGMVGLMMVAVVAAVMIK